MFKDKDNRKGNYTKHIILKWKNRGACDNRLNRVEKAELLMPVEVTALPNPRKVQDSSNNGGKCETESRRKG